MTEQELNQAVEDACGSPDKAFALMRLWQECPKSSNLLYPDPKLAPKHWNVKNKVQIFKERAKGRGYSDKAIWAYLRLHGM